MLFIKHAFFLLLICMSYSCSQYSQKEIETAPAIIESTKDWDSILQEKRLNVLIENSSTSYFIYKGKKVGFEYDILNYFCKDQGIILDVTVADDLDSLTYKLSVGESDVIACNYTITEDRKKEITFSDPIMTSSIVVVQRDNKDSLYQINSVKDLQNKTIHVWRKSSYYSFLDSINKALQLNINIIGNKGSVLGENLVEKVSRGEIDYTVIEENVAIVNENFYDNLTHSESISSEQNIAFGFRKNSPQLKRVFNQWLDSVKTGRKYKYIYHKYFNISKQAQIAHQKFSSLNGESISAFDNDFKKAQNKTGWDWRLIASVAYQESKFNPHIQSYGGAYGMMQFMPNTGPRYGVYPDSPPSVQIIGGAKKLLSEEEYWKDVPDLTERKKFALASYNCGRGHIKDAQRLAAKFELDSLRWTGNVDEMALKLSKKEFYQDECVRHGYFKGYITYHYVENVFLRYNDWSEIYE